MKKVYIVRCCYDCPEHRHGKHYGTTNREDYCNSLKREIDITVNVTVGFPKECPLPDAKE